MEFIINFFRNSAEYKNWGLNIQTIGAVGTMLLTVLQAFGVWEQKKCIQRQQSCESVSESNFAFNTCFFFSFLFYGLHQHKLAIIFNGLILGPICLLVVTEYLKHKNLNTKELLVTAISPIAIILMLALNSSGKEIILSVFLVGLTFFGIVMFVQMKQSKKRGAISLNFLIAAILTNIFWLIYAFTIHNLQLTLSNASSFIIFSAMIFLYWRFGPNKKQN